MKEGQRTVGSGGGGKGVNRGDHWPGIKPLLLLPFLVPSLHLLVYLDVPILL